MSDVFLVLSMFHTFLLPVFSIWHSQAYLSLSSSVHPFFCSSLEPSGGPGPGWELVRLLIKATDVISLERVAQAALLLGNQFAMADAHGVGGDKTRLLPNSCSPVSIKDPSIGSPLSLALNWGQ